MNTFESFLIGFGTGIVFFCFCLLLFIPLDVAKSKKPITPDLNIEVINGVSDTTYIYKNK